MNWSARLVGKLPPIALLTIGLLAIGVPISCYVRYSVLAWQLGGSSASTLTEPFVLVVAIGRGVGALILAALLFLRRNPVAVAITLTAVWLGAAPIDLLLRGIEVLAVSAGQASWAGGSFGWLGRSALFPGLVTIALLVPHGVRRAYGMSRTGS